MATTPTVEIEVGSRVLSLSNPDKVLFPDDGLTKLDLARYYGQVAERALPEISRRPLTLARFPDGIDGKQFFQKDAPKYFPDWIPRAVVPKRGGVVNHALANEAAALVYLAGQACITPHIWLSRVEHLDRPDRLVFDLDPTEPDFGWVRTTARFVRATMAGLGAPTFVQTTGSRGLHVIVPLDGEADFGAVAAVGERVARLLVQASPDRLTVEFHKAARGSRLFLDLTRNAYAQTIVAPYAVRARPGAPVAAPVTWDELDSLDSAEHFTLRSMPDRVATQPDPWLTIDDEACSLSAIVDRLDELDGGAPPGR